MNLREALKLYVIPDRLVGAPLSLEEQTERALQGGATMIQLRDKEMSGRELYETALRLKALCRSRAVPFIVNDRFDVALAAGADGVHLGAADLPGGAVKRLAPRGYIVGLTAHSLEEGLAAQEAGADYVGVGAAFPTGTKEGASVLGVEGIRLVRERLSIPAVAIGGIGPLNVRAVMETGVDGVAVVASVVGQKDIALAAAELGALAAAVRPRDYPPPLEGRVSVDGNYP